LGGTGRLEFTVILNPIIGILLGPWLGGLAAFLGNFIARIIPTTSFYGLLNIPLGPITAITSGALARKSGVGNWKLSAAILGALNALWYLTPPGLEVPYYPFLHLAALIIIILLRDKIADFVKSGVKQKLTIGTAICCFGGIMANHMAGNLIFIASVGWFVSLKAIKDAVVALGFLWLKSGLPKLEMSGLGMLFALVLPISVVERLLMTALATFIGTGMIFAIKKSGLLEKK